MNDENLGKLAGRLGQELDVDGLPDPDNGREFIRAALREAHALGREEQRKKDAEACRNERVDADATGDATDEAYNRACDDCAKAIEEGDRVTGGKREGAGE